MFCPIFTAHAILLNIVIVFNDYKMARKLKKQMLMSDLKINFFQKEIYDILRISKTLFYIRRN